MSRFFEKRWSDLCSSERKQLHVTKKEKIFNDTRKPSTLPDKRESSLSGDSSSEELSISESESSEIEDGSDDD